MTRKQLARIIVKSYDYKTKKDFTKVINFLSVCMFHTGEKQEEEDIQSVIWYLEDRRRTYND